jgi:hypothetical protein
MLFNLFYFQILLLNSLKLQYRIQKVGVDKQDKARNLNASSSI